MVNLQKKTVLYETKKNVRTYLRYVFLVISLVFGIGFASAKSINVTSYQSDYKKESINRTEKLPDFTFYQSAGKKKTAFFQYMAQFAIRANNEVMVQRNKLKKIKNEYFKKHVLSQETEDWLNKLAIQYRFKNLDKTSSSSWEQLLSRVDAVPVSMLLAQSANESAWGTSRFAREGNNMFGQWCFTKGCGIVPKRRAVGGRHQVQKFSSVLASVRSYILNLNTNVNYKFFRMQREKLHKQGQLLSGYTLASGLSKYSERGEAYVSEIRRMIIGNKLERYQTNVG